MILHKEIRELHQEFTTRQILKVLEDFQQSQSAGSVDPIIKAKYDWLYIALRGLNQLIDSTDNLLLS